jgi:hypothetical protein
MPQDKKINFHKVLKIKDNCNFLKFRPSSGQVGACVIHDENSYDISEMMRSAMNDKDVQNGLKKLGFTSPYIK